MTLSKIPPHILRQMNVINGRVTCKRDLAPAFGSRCRAMTDDEVKPGADGVRTILASTDAPVRFGQWRESLSHADGAVDFSTATALCVNHDPNQIAGATRNWELGDDPTRKGGRMARVGYAVNPEARMQSGPTVDSCITDGSLRGASISYDYDAENDADWDNTERTVTVRKWRVMELSLTPIPRDGAAHVERDMHPALRTRSNTPIPQGNPVVKYIQLARFLAILALHPALAEKIRIFAATRTNAAGEIEVTEEQLTGYITQERAEADNIARANASRHNTLIDAMIPLAESHGLSVAPYMTSIRANEIPTMEALTARLLNDKATADATKRTKPVPHGAGSGVTVTGDAGARALAGIEDNIMSRANPRFQNDKGVRGQYTDVVAAPADSWRSAKFSELVKRCARSIHGEADALEWDPNEMAAWFMRNSNIGWANQTAKLYRKSQRDGNSANQVYGGFPGILANIIDKIMVNGFQNYDDITSPMWAQLREVDDFKPFSAAGLALGNLIQVAENTPLPELSLVDSSYQASLAMWGGTLSVTLQMLISDDLGEFFRMLGNIGMIAQRTFDRETYRQLMLATYLTGTQASGYADTTVAPIGAAGSLELVREDFRKKLGPGGNLMGNTPKMLLHPMGMANVVDRALGRAQPPGEQAYLASNAVRAMTPIESTWLDDTTINDGAVPPGTSPASTTSYYLVGGPEVDVVKRCFLRGMTTPQLMEYDAGSQVARKWKTFCPFVAVPATYTDNKGNAARPMGIQRATAS